MPRYLELRTFGRYRERPKIVPSKGREPEVCPEAPWLAQLCASITDHGTSGQIRGRDGSVHASSHRVQFTMHLSGGISGQLGTGK